MLERVKAQPDLLPGRLRLMDSISTNSLSLIHPRLDDEAAAKVRDDTAETGGSDDEELEEYLGKRDSIGDRRGGGDGSGGGLESCVTHGFEACFR